MPSSHDGKIKSVLMGPVYGKKFFIKIEGTMKSTSSCQSNKNFDYVLDTSTTEGEQYMSIILTAYASGSPVSISGYDHCTIYTGVTDFRVITLR